jgi:hypothetical protein
MDEGNFHFSAFKQLLLTNKWETVASVLFVDKYGSCLLSGKLEAEA